MTRDEGNLGELVKAAARDWRDALQTAFVDYNKPTTLGAALAPKCVRDQLVLYDRELPNLLAHISQADEGYRHLGRFECKRVECLIFGFASTIEASADGDVASLVEQGLWQWIPAHLSISAVGQATAHSNKRLSMIDWRANRLVLVTPQLALYDQPVGKPMATPQLALYGLDLKKRPP